MRRKEQEITDREAIDEIINQALICHLSCCVNDVPYLVPLSFGYDGISIFFHSAREGKKTSMLIENPRVCLAFEIGLELIPDQDKACDWGIQFMSVIAEGNAERIEDPIEKEYGLNEIMKQYSGKSWTFPHRDLTKTDVWKIEIKAISGKKSDKDLTLSDLK
jgi:nitroimidazol reductase NimA-like FMN-containing flavoprotein (pyridoxamine 5'-phosphate oxidase superfamily)